MNETFVENWPASLYFFVYVYQSTRLSVRTYIHHPVCPSVHQSVYISAWVSASICVSVVDLSISQSICPTHFALSTLSHCSPGRRLPACQTLDVLTLPLGGHTDGFFLSSLLLWRKRLTVSWETQVVLLSGFKSVHFLFFLWSSRMKCIFHPFSHF